MGGGLLDDQLIGFDSISSSSTYRHREFVVYLRWFHLLRHPNGFSNTWRIVFLVLRWMSYQMFRRRSTFPPCLCSTVDSKRPPHNGFRRVVDWIGADATASAPHCGIHRYGCPPKSPMCRHRIGVASLLETVHCAPNGRMFRSGYRIPNRNNDDWSVTQSSNDIRMVCIGSGIGRFAVNWHWLPFVRHDSISLFRKRFLWWTISNWWPWPAPRPSTMNDSPNLHAYRCWLCWNIRLSSSHGTSASCAVCSVLTYSHCGSLGSRWLRLAMLQSQPHKFDFR